MIANIDFSELLVTKAVAKKKPRKSAKKTNVMRLGDEARLANLPDAVDSVFLGLYKNSLEQVVQPYVIHGRMSVTQASDYISAVMANIFGDERHLGIYDYLLGKNVFEDSHKNLVVTAEQFIINGWRIKETEAGRFWLFSNERNKVVEMTGTAKIGIESAALTIDSSSAHLMLDEKTAAQIHALAREVDSDADELARLGSLDVLLPRITDKQFAGYIVNYNGLMHMLNGGRYSTADSGLTLADLYKAGYRLSHEMIFPLEAQTVITDGKSTKVIKPVANKVNKSAINTTLLGVLASKVRESLYEGIRGAVSETVTELKELNYTVAVMADLLPITASFRDNYDIVEGLTGERGKRIRDALAVTVLTSFLVGEKFTLADIEIETMSGKVLSLYNERAFSQELPARAGGEDVDFLNFRPEDSLATLVRIVPDKFIHNLKSFELDTSEYDLEMPSVRQYFEAAKQMVLELR